jgi:hypothetical protein
MTSSTQDNSSSNAVAVTAAWTGSNCLQFGLSLHLRPGPEFCASPAIDELPRANCALGVPSFNDKRRP